VSNSIRIMILCLILILTTSCVRNEQLEKLSIISAIGFDSDEGDKIKGTSVIGQFDPSQKDITEVLSSTAYTSKMIRQIINLGTRNKMVSGQIRVVLFGSELAESGNLINIVDTMSRDPAIGTMVYLGLSETTAEDVLQIKPNRVILVIFCMSYFSKILKVSYYFPALFMNSSKITMTQEEILLYLI
jgi:spore germination protein